MGTTPAWQSLNQALNPEVIQQSFDLGDMLMPSFRLSQRLSDDSAHEAGSNGVSSRGDSGEQGAEIEEFTRNFGSLEGSASEKIGKLSATANSKNRLAQKRYRERQKGKMETYKQQVEELSKRLGDLQTENESLEKRNRLLEKVVQMKDQKPKPAPPVPTGVFDGPGQNIWQNTDTYVAVAEYINSIHKQRDPLMTPQQAAYISPEDLRQVRVDYVKELATLLLAHGDDQTSNGHKQLEDYVLQVRLAAISLLNSMSVRSFAQVLAMKRRMSMTGSISDKIMHVLNLSPDQKRDYITARKQLIARNEEIKEKRRRIVSDLELAIPSIAPLMCGQTASMLQACESSDQFKASLEEEHRSMAQFHIDCVQLLTPLQEARMLLEAHPGSPDPWLISGYVEAEQNGNLKQWLASHVSQTGRTSLDLTAPDLSSDPASTSGYGGTFSGKLQSALNRASATGDPLNGHPQSTAGAGIPRLASVDAVAPKLEPLPLESSPQGLQDFHSAPSLDSIGLEGFAQDDMWVDFFPGLMTQSLN